MTKPKFSMNDPKSSRLVEEALPGNPPTSPNMPENARALRQVGVQYDDAVQAERRAILDATRHKASE